MAAQDQQDGERRQARPQRGQAQPQRGQARPQRGQAQPQSRRAQPRRGQGQQPAQQRPPQQESEPFIHGISFGAGLAIYQGDFTRNPEHNPIKYIAGSGKLSVQAGADHRLGRYDQYGLGIDLVYNRLSGETTGGRGFSANSVYLDFYGDYELPYIKQGLFRVFLGIGPNLIVSPTYDNFPEEGSASDNFVNSFDKRGTRVIGSMKVGVTILDKFRIGTRISSSDFLDGYEGFNADGIPDFVSFLSFRYRFDRKY